MVSSDKTLVIFTYILLFTYYGQCKKIAANDSICYETEQLVRGLYNPLSVAFIDENGMLIAEHRGTVRMHDFRTGHLSTFLDITDRVVTSFAPMHERGLLGLALDPKFERNHFFYVFYSTPSANPTTYDHDSVVSRFHAEKDGDSWRGIKDRELEIIRIAQPGPRQNGGQVFFSDDGHLYITTGDGGDRENKRFHKESLLGKILRISVRNSSKKEPYRIPTDNPFTDEKGARPEVYAYGFRNPWRCTIDKSHIETQSERHIPTRIFCGDLGEPERNIEDLNLVHPGGRYGWLDDPTAKCHTAEECHTKNIQLPTSDVLPVHSYKKGEGQAVIGGIVYTGNQFQYLKNHYIFGDYIHGMFHTLTENNDVWTVHSLCINFPEKLSEGTERVTRHILGIEKMGPEDIIILTNTAMTNDQPTGEIFKLKAVSSSSDNSSNKRICMANFITFIIWLVYMMWD